MASYRSLAGLIVLCLSLSACTSWFNKTNSSDPEESGFEEYKPSYYFSEFIDVPIDNALSEKKSQTFITFLPSGEKAGVQVFSGRIDQVELMNNTRRDMAASGWILRSLMRGKQSIILFEKADRFCTITISEGSLFTSMTVFVSSRLKGDSGNFSSSSSSMPHVNSKSLSN